MSYIVGGNDSSLYVLVEIFVYWKNEIYIIVYLYSVFSVAVTDYFIAEWNTCSKAILTAHTIQSKTIIKLNPMNSPRTPPQSATKEDSGKAGSSLITSTVFVENTRVKWVPGSTDGPVNGSSVNWERYKKRRNTASFHYYLLYSLYTPWKYMEIDSLFHPQYHS